MDKKGLERFKKLLLKKREEIISDVSRMTEETRRQAQHETEGKPAGSSLHIADAASDSYDREFSFNLASGERETLIEIDEALERIEDKSYGSCVACGKKISRKRLTAVPHAKFCLPCKQDEEKK